MTPRQITFKEYQDRTKDTAFPYIEAIDKIVEEGFGTGKQVIMKLLRINYVALGLGEVGEIQGKIKKIIRDSGGQVTPEVNKAIKKECGDLLWYVSGLCNEFGWDLGEVAAENLSKLASRKERGVLMGNGDDR